MLIKLISNSSSIIWISWNIFPDIPVHRIHCSTCVACCLSRISPSPTRDRLQTTHHNPQCLSLRVARHVSIDTSQLCSDHFWCDHKCGTSLVQLESWHPSIAVQTSQIHCHKLTVSCCLTQWRNLSACVGCTTDPWWCSHWSRSVSRRKHFINKINMNDQESVWEQLDCTHIHCVQCKSSDTCEITKVLTCHDMMSICKRPFVKVADDKLINCEISKLHTFVMPNNQHCVHYWIMGESNDLELNPNIP